MVLIVLDFALFCAGCGKSEKTPKQPSKEGTSATAPQHPQKQNAASQAASEKQSTSADTGTLPEEDEQTPIKMEDQKDVTPEEFSSHRVLYQEGVDATIVKDGKPVTERIVVYGVAGLRFSAGTLAVDHRVELTKTVIVIGAANGGFLVPEQDSAVPVNMGFDDRANFGLSFFTHAVNVTWVFANAGIRFHAEGSDYESERDGAAISFTEDGVQMDGIKKTANE